MLDWEKCEQRRFYSVLLRADSKVKYYKNAFYHSPVDFHTHVQECARTPAHSSALLRTPAHSRIPARSRTFPHMLACVEMYEYLREKAKSKKILVSHLSLLSALVASLRKAVTPSLGGRRVAWLYDSINHWCSYGRMPFLTSP